MGTGVGRLLTGTTALAALLIWLRNQELCKEGYHATFYQEGQRAWLWTLVARGGI